MLTNAMEALALKVVKDMKYDIKRCERYASSSLSLVTALAPVIGHSVASEAVSYTHLDVYKRQCYGSPGSQGR